MVIWCNVSKKEARCYYRLQVRSCLPPFEKPLHIHLQVRTVNNCNMHAILFADRLAVVPSHSVFLDNCFTV